ncbi:hypothetical protein KIPB_001159, partial [Kipferlia bialata]
VRQPGNPSGVTWLPERAYKSVY